MKKQYKLGVIGAGFMAQAILKGAIYSDSIKPKKIIVSDASEQALEKLEYLGVNRTRSNADVADNCEYLLIAVKPQNFEAVAESIRGVPVEKVITIMAGVRKDSVRSALLGTAVKVARAMPNLPCSIGSGMVALDAEEFAGNIDDCAFIDSLFSNCGTVLNVSEEKLNAVTGISGSGPAYVYLFIDGLIKAGVAHGLTEDEAKTLAVTTVYGGAEMVAHAEDKSIDELVSAVCSKGGTTIQAVDSFRRDDLEGVIARAVDACVKRAEELSD